MIFLSLYSRKLHCFCCRESTTALTSRTARALSFDEYGLYHFVRRTLPCRLISKTKWIIAAGAGCSEARQGALYSEPRRALESAGAL